MKLLAEISDRTLGIGESEVIGNTYELRKSARAILRKPDGTIAVQYLTNHQFHKLPGGGVEHDETLEEALQRELLEEVGCHATIQNCIGVVIEYRAKYNMIAISYCFIADVIEPILEPKLDHAEIEEGVTHIWIAPEEAIEKMRKDPHTKYQTPFILARELTFLKEYIALTKK